MKRKNSAELKDKRLFCLFVAEQNELRAIKHQVATEHLAGTGPSAGCSEMTEIDQVLPWWHLQSSGGCRHETIKCMGKIILTHTVCFGLNCLLQNAYDEIPVLSTLECDLIWGQALHRGNQVKMRSLGWPLIQHEWCPYKKGKSGHRDMHRGKTV